MKSQKGEYKKKRLGVGADPEITKAVTGRVINGELPCLDAEDIAATLNKSLLKVGTVLDMMEISITKCQLGLFGYHPSKKIVLPSEFIDSSLEEAIRNNLADGSLSCYSAWEIAIALGVPKINVASACEALGIKINSCQLGAF